MLLHSSDFAYLTPLHVKIILFPAYTHCEALTVVDLVRWAYGRRLRCVAGSNLGEIRTNIVGICFIGVLEYDLPLVIVQHINIVAAELPVKRQDLTSVVGCRLKRPVAVSVRV
jgi:hypothetical protein